MRKRFLGSFTCCRYLVETERTSTRPSEQSDSSRLGVLLLAVEGFHGVEAGSDRLTFCSFRNVLAWPSTQAWNLVSSSVGNVWSAWSRKSSNCLRNEASRSLSGFKRVTWSRMRAVNSSDGEEIFARRCANAHHCVSDSRRQV